MNSQTTFDTPPTKAYSWLKILLCVAGAVVCLSIIIRVIGMPSGHNEDRWQPEALVTSCYPVWNANQGWCNLGNFPEGTYRVVPKFSAWQMKIARRSPTDPKFLPVPPQGLDVQRYLGNNDAIAKFFRSAFVKSRYYGALIIRKRGEQAFEALSSSRRPKEFQLNKSGTVEINVNLPMFPANFTGNIGQLTIELQKISD